MFRCLPSYLEHKKVSSPIAVEVGKHLFVGACPLLSHLISDKEFMRVSKEIALLILSIVLCFYINHD